MDLLPKMPLSFPGGRELAAIATTYHRHKLQIGETVGIFVVREVLQHQGNVSTVYLGESTVDLPDAGIFRGGRFIIKGIPIKPSTSHSTNERNLRSFFNEIRVLPMVNQPAQNNIVRMVAANADPARTKLYMVLEELAYKSVRDKYPDKKLDPEIVLGIARCLTRALTHLHNLGIVHGDVKPDNFMLDMAGEAVLVDFGSAFFTGRKGGGKVAVPPDQDEFKEPFTPLYCSPELARYKLYGGPPNPKDEASDVWALGVTLWELLVGERPFSWMQGETLTRILEEAGRGTLPVRPDALSNLGAAAGAKSAAEAYRFLHGLITRMLTVQRDKRVTAFEAHGEILGFLRQKGITTHRQALDTKTLGRLEMARKIAMMDEPIGPDDQGERKTKRRTTAAMELKALEMRESYLKSGKNPGSTMQKGWFTPPSSSGQAPPPAEKDAPASHREVSFEEFKRSKGAARPPADQSEKVSFEEFARLRRLDDIQRLKNSVEGSADTKAGGSDTKAGQDQTTFEDYAETSLDPALLSDSGLPECADPRAQTDDAGDSSDTQVDPLNPAIRKRRGRAGPPDPEKQ